MRPIQNMRVIQIEITNACIHKCGNCTRFCGHHKKPFFMDFETFQKAVDSLEEFPGMIGIMGGEPTIHPEFELFVKYLVSKTTPCEPLQVGLEPIRSMNEHIIKNKLQDFKARRGLWSSLGPGYYKHYELIQESFPFQLINDHSNSGLHQTMLASRKELGIPDDKWIELRDNCWIQNGWSASITPKGCFFCEVAAAMDMLFDGPGGWPIEPGWWKRTPDDFGDQLNWCELCGATLKLPRVQGNQGIDTISPALYEELQKLGSPKIKAGLCEKIDIPSTQNIDNGADYSAEWYLPKGDNTQRVSSTNESLSPKSLKAIIVDSAGFIEQTLAMNEKHFDNIYVLTSNNNLKTNNLSSNTEIIFCSNDNFRNQLNAIHKQLKPNDWVMMANSDTVLSNTFRDQFSKWIFNPGCLHLSPDQIITSQDSNTKIDGISARVVSQAQLPPLPVSFILYSMRAKSLKKQESFSPTKTNEALFQQFMSLWPSHKQITLFDLSLDQHMISEELNDLSSAEKEHNKLMISHMMNFWATLTRLSSRIALFGAGQHTRWLIESLKKNRLPLPILIIDETPSTKIICDIPVTSPKKIECSIDTIVVSSDMYAKEMTQKAKQIWPDITILNPYEHFTDPVFQKTHEQTT